MRYKILIVDDAYINRELLKEILRDDYDILEAENGKEALEIIEKEAENINAVLLDLIMPVMDGFEVLERMQSKKILDKIPVLVISGETRMQIKKNVLTMVFLTLSEDHIRRLWCRKESRIW